MSWLKMIDSIEIFVCLRKHLCQFYILEFCLCVCVCGGGREVNELRIIIITVIKIKSTKHRGSESKI